MAKAARMPESGILRSVHKVAAGLHGAGLIDSAEMGRFEPVCLTVASRAAPQEIKARRERE